MRKMAKGAAITGGVFSVLAILFNIISLISSIILSGGNRLSFVSTGLGILTTLLLCIALFRCKADVFAGVVCLLTAVLALWTMLSNGLSFFNYLNFEMGDIALFSGFNSLAELLRTAALVLMAVLCFRKKAGKNILCFLLALAAVFLSMIATVGLAALPSLGFGFDLAVLLSVFVSLLGTAIGGLPLILAGVAIGCSRVVETAAPSEQNEYQYQTPEQT